MLRVAARPIPSRDSARAAMTSKSRDVGPITLDATLRAPAAPASRPEHLPLLGVTFQTAAAPSEPRDVPADLTVSALLGEGGMGSVYLARQHILDRDVAIKLPRTSDDAAVIESLLREGRLMGSLEHPSIVPVHALGRDALGRPLIVMNRVDGVTWADLLLRGESGGTLDRHLEILIGRWLWIGVAANLLAAVIGSVWPRLMTGVGTIALAITVVVMLEQGRRSASGR